MNEIETFKFRYIIYKFSKVDKCNKFCLKTVNNFQQIPFFTVTYKKCFVAFK